MPVEGTARLAPDPAVQAFGASDRVSTTVELRNPGVQEVRAEVDPRSALIPADQDGDRTLGILSDSEAQVFDGRPFHRIGGVRITSLDVSDTEVRLTVTTNIAAGANLYLAVLGRRDDGREVFLSGDAPYDVAEEDTIAQALRRDGHPIPKSNLLRIPVSGASSPDQSVTEVITLDQETANVTKFLRLLPDQVRVVGRLIVPPDGGLVAMKKPVQFRLRFGLSQPMRVGGEIAFSNTTGADLGALESLVSSESAVSIDELGFRIPYENEFPLSTTLQLDALDHRGAVLGSIPESSTDTLRFQPAPITQGGASAGRGTGIVGARQSREQLQSVSKGDSLRMNVHLQSPANREVVLQAKNGFSLRLEGTAKLQIDPSN